jgi:hypothetical protein
MMNFVRERMRKDAGWPASSGRFRPVLLLIAFCFLLGSVSARVLEVHVEDRQPVLDGREFAPWGAYELVSGYILFGLDPANAANERIVDLCLAPRSDQGLVEGRANFVALRPDGGRRGSGIVLVEVSNRGGKFSMRYFNRAETGALRADDPDSFGDGLLMRQGLAVVWVGWQPDVPPREDVLRLEAPVARNVDGSPLTGLVRADWTVDEPTVCLPLSHRNHLPYPVADPADSANVLTVRGGRDEARRVVPRERWRFARLTEGGVVPDEEHIYMESGFEAGKIYELVYRGRRPWVTGTGLAVIRDIVAYAKYDPAAEFPARFGIAAGVSQTGRFLRHYLYQGFNTDESGRMAYDGLMIITAGAGRGSFNHRFAQPSRDAHRYSAFFYPTDIFPFAGQALYDAMQCRTDGLLAHHRLPEHLPKIFYINTGYEYWGRAASLIHTTPDGTRDVAPSASERIYHLASCQHFTSGFPPAQEARKPDTTAYRGSPLEFKVNYRALLLRMVEWVSGKAMPPPSAYPRLADGTLVAPEDVKFPWIAGVDFPAVIHQAYRADYGPRWTQGIVDNQPPRLGPPFPSMVAQVDNIGNELGGVRNVEIRVPLATYTPWNLRWDQPGQRNELTDFLGTYIPLPRDSAEKDATSDPRPSIDTLYVSRDDYLEKVRAAAAELVREGFLLPDDRDYVLSCARVYWDWIQAQPAAVR